MADQLVSFVEKKAGRSLRAIIEYEQRDIDVLYHRDDLAASSVEQRTRSVYDQIIQIRESRDDALVTNLGRKRATLQVREEAVIIHLLERQNKGHLISLEPDAASDLTTFLSECLQYVE